MSKHLVASHLVTRRSLGFCHARRSRQNLLSTTVLTTGRLSLTLVLLSFVWLQDAQANPKGGHVVGGAAKIVQTSPKRLDIRQTSDKAIINWQSFSIDKGEHTKFHQPSKSSVALNRVVGGDLSTIAGRLSANGNLILINPNGVLFTKSAQVDVHGLIASTSDIGNRDFMAGRFDFSAASDPSSFVINRGSITAAEGGLVALVAPWVENSGVIAARLGRVELASGGTFTVDLYGDRLIQLAVPEADDGAGIIPAALSDPARVSNAGGVSVDGGVVAMTVADAQQIVSNVINMDGVVEARSVQQVAGRIVLNGGNTGIVSVSGTLDASGKDAGEAGGQVAVLGEKVGLFDGAVVDVSGDLGGGTTLIGGNFQGAGPEANAKATYVAEGARIHADALRKGKGGTAIVWADEGTRFEGAITARGGQEGGDGGFVEVSGKENLAFWGNVDVGAPVGETGTLLLDPNNIRIVGDDTFSGISGEGTEADPFTTTGDNAFLWSAVLEEALLTSNVVVQTGAAGASSEAGNITIETEILPVGDSESEVVHDLTLIAHQDIIFESDGRIDFSDNDSVLRLHADATETNGKGAIVNNSSAESVILLGAGGAELKAGSGIGTIFEPVTIGNSGTVAAETLGGSIFITSNDDLVVGAVGETSGLKSAFDVSLVASNIVSLESIAAQTGGVALVADTVQVADVFAGQSIEIVGSNGVVLQGSNYDSSLDFSVLGDTVLQNDVFVETEMGGVNFSGSIDGPWNLSLTAGLNDEGGTFVTIADSVGSQTPLRSLFAHGDQIRLGDVTTTGDQTYDPRQRSSGIGFTSFGGNYVTGGGDFIANEFTQFVSSSSITTSGGDITFGGIVNGFSSEGGTVNPDLTLVSGDGAVSFQGLVGDDVALGEVDATGSNSLSVRADEETTALLIDDLKRLSDDPLPDGFNVGLLLPEFVPEPPKTPDADTRPDPDPNRTNPRLQIPRYDEPARLVDASPVAEAQNPLIALANLETLSNIAPGAGPESASESVVITESDAEAIEEALDVIVETCPDVVLTSLAWQNTPADAAFSLKPTIVPYSVDEYCAGYLMAYPGRGSGGAYQGLSFITRDFWTDLEQSRDDEVVPEMLPSFGLPKRER